MKDNRCAAVPLCEAIKIILMIFLCVAGALLNYLINLFVTNILGIPLYLDTIMTIAVTFFAGLWWGCLTGALTNILGIIITRLIWGLDYWGLEGTLFALCNITTAVIVWLFIRMFPKEIDLNYKQIFSADIFIKSSRINKIMNSIIVLTLVSFALCLAMSILGGTIATLINIAKQNADINMVLLHTELALINLFSENIPLIVSQILSRIPVNIVDRIISVFAGFGIALLMKKINLNFTTVQALCEI